MIRWTLQIFFHAALATTLGALVAASSMSAMFYKPLQVAELWDTWMYYHEGVHYLFYLHKSAPDKRWDGISVATSKDGVHYKEIGPVFKIEEGSLGMGSGHVWRAGGRFIMNYNENRAGQPRVMLFAESPDLIHWRRLAAAEYGVKPEPKWYRVPGRWDCIYGLPRVEGQDAGFYGYFTASARDDWPYRSVGMAESDDGVRWRAMPPPLIEWGGTPPKDFETAACERIGSKYYLMLGAHYYMGIEGYGIFTFIGDSPIGPFRPDVAAFRLMGASLNPYGPSTHGPTAFMRFYRSPDGMLITNYHTTRRPAEGAGNARDCWAAPLKTALVDAEGHLRMGYWKGNDAVKGRKIAVDLSAAERAYPSRLPEKVAWKASATVLDIDAGEQGRLMYLKRTMPRLRQAAPDTSSEAVVALLAERLDLRKGVVLEGTLLAGEASTLAGPAGKFGFYIGEKDGQGTVVLLHDYARTETGILRHADRARFDAEDVIGPGSAMLVPLASARKHSFRLLVREYLLELYVDNILAQMWHLPMTSNGRLGFVVQHGRYIVADVAAWEMSLD